MIRVLEHVVKVILIIGLQFPINDVMVKIDSPTEQ